MSKGTLITNSFFSSLTNHQAFSSNIESPTIKQSVASHEIYQHTLPSKNGVIPLGDEERDILPDSAISLVAVQGSDVLKDSNEKLSSIGKSYGISGHPSIESAASSKISSEPEISFPNLAVGSTYQQRPTSQAFFANPPCQCQPAQQQNLMAYNATYSSSPPSVYVPQASYPSFPYINYSPKLLKIYFSELPFDRYWIESYAYLVYGPFRVANINYPLRSSSKNSDAATKESLQSNLLPPKKTINKETSSTRRFVHPTNSISYPNNTSVYSNGFSK